MITKIVFASAVVALAMGATAARANAPVVYSENFNDAAFVGSVVIAGGTPGGSSDRWADTTYYTIDNADGWTFTGSAGLAQNTGTTDGALLLNECCIPSGSTLGGGGSTLVSGLTPGQTYTVSFLLSGDNEPGQAYQLDVGVNLGGTTTDFAVNGVDGAAGSSPGTMESFSFTPTASTETLAFAQTQQGNSQGSPIVDDITISAAPEPATWALMILGVAGFGGALRFARRREQTASA